MRLKILMCFLQPASVPWGYPHWARGLVCTAVGWGLYQAAHRLHAPGWGHPEERRYKLLTYSWPHGLRSVRTGLWPQGAAAWWVPSPVPAAVEGLAPGLPGTEFRLRPQPVTEKQIGVEPTPAFTVRSPTTLSACRRPADGKVAKQYHFRHRSRDSHGRWRRSCGGRQGSSTGSRSQATWGSGFVLRIAPTSGAGWSPSRYPAFRTLSAWATRPALWRTHHQPVRDAARGPASTVECLFLFPC